MVAVWADVSLVVFWADVSLVAVWADVSVIAVWADVSLVVFYLRVYVLNIIIIYACHPSYAYVHLLKQRTLKRATSLNLQLLRPLHAAYESFVSSSVVGFLMYQSGIKCL